MAEDSYEDLRNKVLQVSSAKYYIRYMGETFAYNEPSLELETEAYCKYKMFYKRAIDEGFLTQEGEKKLLRQNLVWSDRDEQEMKQMVEDIKKLNAGRSQYRFQSNKLKSIDTATKRLEEEVTGHLLRKNSFLSQTANYQAMQDKFQFLLRECTEDLHGRLIWPTQEDLDADQDMKRVNFLISKIFYEKIFPESEIRKIARNEPWRTTWRLSVKTGTSLFNRSASEFTRTQSDLCHWSMLYDSVYESMECPGSDVIEDDELLNRWFIDQYEKKSGNETTSSEVSNAKISQAQEVFIKVDTPEDAKKVYETMNTSESRRIIQSRQKALFEKGELREDELPDVKRNISMQKTQEYIGKMKQT
jgi:hypothetical protein